MQLLNNQNSRSDQHSPQSSGAIDLSEFLIFGLDQEEYAIDIHKVQELRGYDAVTHIANTPDHIKGVINLRGAIVPIIDMRIRFGNSTPVYGTSTVVVILNLAAAVLGIVVDSVSDVITLNPAQIKPAPQLGAAFETNYMVGIGTLNERNLIIVDMEELISGMDFSSIANPAACS